METQLYRPQASGARLVILEQEQLRVCELDVQTSWRIGRYDPASLNPPHIPLSSNIASREHGQLVNLDGRWYYLDNPKNLNGTFHNGVKLPKSPTGQPQWTPLESGDVLRIDNDDLDHVNSQGVFMLYTTAPTQGVWMTHTLDQNETYIGRDPSCQIVEPISCISSRHAKITWKAGQYQLTDCNSTAGTFLNSKRITGTVPLREKDVISLCGCSYILIGSKLLYAHSGYQEQQLLDTAPHQRPVILQADIRTKRVKDNSGAGMKELIRDIHLEIRQGTLVALLGTAGAGKSTVMNCLNGMDLTGVEGSVFYRGVDLMRDFEQVKFRIGSVPQKKVFHKTFTPEKEFRLAAQKRLPADTTRQEIQERVDRTLEMLSMTGVRRSRNSKLSGGEQTRVNVGIELVADRDLLCLDEPDQGLSPNYKHELFEILRNLAHKNGKSILTIIHDVSEIHLFDQVIMLAKADGVGRLAFSGTPDQAKEFFGADIRDAYALLERTRTAI